MPKERKHCSWCGKPLASGYWMHEECVSEFHDAYGHADLLGDWSEERIDIWLTNLDFDNIRRFYKLREKLRQTR